MQTTTGAPATTDAPAHAREKESLSALVKFILETHHVFTRAAIATLPPLAAAVRGRHGDVHPETTSVERLVQRLVDDLGPHMFKEERILFPYIESLESDCGGDACFPTVRNPIGVMLREHDTVEQILGELRAVTANYTLPAGRLRILQGALCGSEGPRSRPPAPHSRRERRPVPRGDRARVD